MMGGFGPVSHHALGPRHSRVVVRTASVLGLLEDRPVHTPKGPSTRRASERDDLAGERSLLCLVLPSPRLPARSRSAGRSGIASVAVHVTAVAIVMSLAWSRPTARHAVSAAPDRPQAARLVFLLQPGPGGGGGG